MPELEILASKVKVLMLKDWTEKEVEKLNEFMEDVIIGTMLVSEAAQSLKGEGESKWEYMFELLSANDPTSRLQQMNKLGSQGWELVALKLDEYLSNDYWCYFKRKIAPPNE